MAVVDGVGDGSGVAGDVGWFVVELFGEGLDGAGDAGFVGG